jgi:hypothetical protein
MGGWVGGRMGIRGEYRFNSLVKLKNNEKNYALFYFAGREFFLYIYDVIVKQKIKKLSVYHYFFEPACVITGCFATEDIEG